MPINRIIDAPKPKMTAMEVVSTVAYWAFPPTAIWALLKLAVNKLAGNALGRVIIQSQNSVDRDLRIDAEKKMTAFYTAHENDPSISMERETVRTYDGAMLDTFELRPQNSSSQPRVHIINFIDPVTSTACYEEILDQMKQDALELKANVIGFNSRGVAESTGTPKSSHDLVIDGIAQVQRLVARGVDPEKIVLKGRALGGATAALVAAHCHAHGQKVNLFEANSFSTYTNLVVARIRTGLGHRLNEPLRWRILGWFAKPFIKLGLVLAKWEMNAAAAYKKVPDTHQEYMLIRSSKEGREAGNLDDPIVPHYASLHLALKEERELQKKKLREAKAGVYLATQCYNLIHPPLREAINNIDEAKKMLKQRKMEVNARLSSSTSGHSLSFEKLQDRYQGNNAHSFFKSFINRAMNHHQQVKKKLNTK